MLQMSLQVIFYLLLPILIESKDSWTYDNKDRWQEKHHYCDGNLQSPIDIHLNQSMHNVHLKPLFFEKNLRPTSKLDLFNNGYTAQLNLSGHYILKHVAPHSEDYIVEQVHFHWSHANDIKNGSEHLLNGESFPFELHVVTYSSLYSDIAEAMTNVRGLAVVGVFFEIGNEPNKYLEPIINASRHINHKNTRTELSEDFHLIPLIGKNGIPHYYRYDGSLTTPPCYESVVWSVIPEPQKMSLHQLNTLKKLHDVKNQIMKDIYRLPLELGTRKLYRSFRLTDVHHDKTTEFHSAASEITYKNLVFIVLSILIFRN